MAEVPAGTDQVRVGVAVLGRGDRRLVEAALRSVASSGDRPDAVVLTLPKTRSHLYDPTGLMPVRVVRADSPDELPIQEPIRTLAPLCDVIVFVPEGVVLGPDYIRTVRARAGLWQDMVGELDVIDYAIAGETDPPAWNTPVRPAQGLVRLLQAKTLRACVLWIRVEVCAGMRFGASPSVSEFLAFSSVLDRLRRHGRTRVIASGLAAKRRFGPERRSGFEAGRELYRTLDRQAARDERSDAAFEARAHSIDPRIEKLRLFGEQMFRYAASAATRDHVGSFLKGMWTARREAAGLRDRVRADIRKLR